MKETLNFEANRKDNFPLKLEIFFFFFFKINYNREVGFDF